MEPDFYSIVARLPFGLLSRAEERFARAIAFSGNSRDSLDFSFYSEHDVGFCTRSNQTARTFMAVFRNFVLCCGVRVGSLVEPT
jgi:hypothetical protein